jgi:hypothetical protein
VARQSNRSKAKPPSTDAPAAEVEETTAGSDTTEPAAAETPAETPAETAEVAEVAEVDAVESAADDDAEDDDADETGVDPAEQRALWDELRIDPIEIALPGGTGYTLRAYRMSNELTPTDTSDREEDDLFAVRAREDEEDDDADLFTEEELAQQAEAAGKAERKDRDDEDEDADEADADAEAELDEDEEEEEEEEPDAEEVPVFLTHRGKLLLFRSAEGLVSFIRSGAPNDFAQVDTWATLVDRLEPVNVAPLDEDSYELDLVVENLRGGHDSWDPPLIIEAGEVARDLSYALRLPAVLDMLSPGNSLDDLDEALRGVVDGGIGGFMARRRLRKIGAQTASLGWRTIIGKISAAVDWRD